jgi:hypothetical protein
VGSIIVTSGAPPELLPNQIVRGFYSQQQRPVCPPSHSISPCQMAACDSAAPVRRSASKTLVHCISFRDIRTKSALTQFPRTTIRVVAIPGRFFQELQAWKAERPDRSPATWLFPPEKGKTPIGKDYVWRRNIRPAPAKAGLGWVNFLIFRWTQAGLMRVKNAEPKAVTDNMGHPVDVNQNVHARPPRGAPPVCGIALCVGSVEVVPWDF